MRGQLNSVLSQMRYQASNSSAFTVVFITCGTLIRDLHLPSISRNTVTENRAFNRFFVSPLKPFCALDRPIRQQICYKPYSSKRSETELRLKKFVNADPHAQCNT